jgi:hypothetical protein
MIADMYTSRLAAGLGLIEETDRLLDLWRPGMTPNGLYQVALDSGVFPSMSARRLKDVVTEGFGARYLIQQGQPAKLLKQVQNILSQTEYRQLLMLMTARAHDIFADFVRQVYWPAYGANKLAIERDEALQFVERANQDGKTTKHWAASTVRRVASYLIGCCIDFGLLSSEGEKSACKIIGSNLKSKVALILSYELHFSGLGDNAVMNHHDWQLFGLEPLDVIGVWRSLSGQGHLIVQSAGGIVNVSWKYEQMSEVVDGITG